MLQYRDMYAHETTLRVRYGETDAMGYVYHGNYAEWLEVARVELLREIGMPYTCFEKLDIIMPVREMSIRYLKPAHYDELITIRTFLEQPPAFRVQLRYELYNEGQELISTAQVLLVPYDRSRKRPCLPPEDFLKLLNPYFRNAMPMKVLECL